MCPSVRPEPGRDDDRCHARHPAAARNGLACTADGWEAVTDPAVVRVTALQFNVTQETSGSVGVRAVQIILSGELPSDSSISRSLTRVVKVRNDVYTP